MTYEEAQDIHSSPMWEKVCSELDLWIASESLKLRNCTIDQVKAIQQTIRDFEKVKALPDLVKDREATVG